MDGASLDMKQEQLERLKTLFPEAVSEGKIDFERLKQTLGEEVVTSGERYVLTWAGKSDAFKAIQTSTTATFKPQKNESVDFDTTENIFIEGENLEVLKVLQKSYYGKVKMIYIDPPYNTGNDRALWEKIHQKTTYRVEYATADLIKEAAENVRKMPAIIAPRIIAQRTEVVMDTQGVRGETKSTLDKTKRLLSENQKIECGKKHFRGFDEVRFEEATSLEDIEKSI